MRADDVGVVRVALREQRVEERFLDDSVGLVLHALPALVAHDVLLVRQRAGGDLLQQIAHPVRLEPERQLEPIRRHGLEVVRPVEAGRAVQVAGAGALEQLDVLVARHVLRALEHHVLEQVREAGAPGGLVGRADVIPQVDGRQGQPVVLGEDHGQAVGQRVLLEGDRTARRQAKPGAAPMRQPGRRRGSPKGRTRRQNAVCSWLARPGPGSGRGRDGSIRTMTSPADVEFASGPGRSALSRNGLPGRPTAASPGRHRSGQRDRGVDSICPGETGVVSALAAAMRMTGTGGPALGPDSSIRITWST